MMLDDRVLDEFIEEYQEFLKSIKLDGVVLDDVIREYPARKARFSIALEKMRAKLAELKLKQKTLYYELYKEYRKEAIEKGLKITEEGLKSLVMTDSRYIEISEEVIEAETKVGILEACKEALDDQGRMLYLLYGNPERKF